MTGQGGEPGAAQWPIGCAPTAKATSAMIPAAPGRYTVKLTFVEPTFAKGERVFDVLVNDKPVLSDFDVAGRSEGRARRGHPQPPGRGDAAGLT
jgi:beta-galactosidase